MRCVRVLKLDQVLGQHHRVIKDKPALLLGVGRVLLKHRVGANVICAAHGGGGQVRPVVQNRLGGDFGRGR